MQIPKSQLLSLAMLAGITFYCSSLQAAEKVVKLTSASTKIEFVGSHVVEKKPDPDSRKGKFQELNGTATVTDGKLTGISVTIETSSISTGNSKLDAHLKSPDFFSVRQYPKASFNSTKIESTADSKVKITGEFKLLKETKTISFPATVNHKDGLSLDAKFIIDRSQFGMNFGIDKIDKNVEMTISIAK
ncbi:MAG: YceI family protein [Planctomicrobium sp.]|jgi:polyisoprenoid-binding protein YceI|nr:YceI family protein [Planctomicrobium sp.]